MTGLEIARDFFFSWGRPFLTAQFPGLADRVAASRILGSDVLRGDDEISRDHDWGPQFDVFLFGRLCGFWRAAISSDEYRGTPPVEGIGSGELSGWRLALHEYPEEVLRSRLAEECFRVWQQGEYNFVQRMTRRRDPIATSVCPEEFVTGVMRIVLLMNRDFTPYWKWLAFEFRKRSQAQPYLPMLEELVSIRLIERQVEIVQNVVHWFTGNFWTAGG